MSDFLNFSMSGGGQIHDMSQYMTEGVIQPGESNSMVQSPVSAPPPVQFKKAKWTQEEDKLLVDSVKAHGMGNWSLVAQTIPGRTGKQCRERWINQLCPALNKDNWSTQEDAILVQQQRLHGNVWSKIAQFLPGRSANAVKNRWSWLSRHRVPPSLAAQMMPFVVQQQKQQQKPPSQRMPPMPQIYHPQQTAPPEVQWGTPQEQIPRTNLGRFAFSDPIEPLSDHSAPMSAGEHHMFYDFGPGPGDDMETSISHDDLFGFSMSNDVGFRAEEHRHIDDWDAF